MLYLVLFRVGVEPDLREAYVVYPSDGVAFAECGYLNVVRVFNVTTGRQL